MNNLTDSIQSLGELELGFGLVDGVGISGSDGNFLRDFGVEIANSLRNVGTLVSSFGRLA